MCGIAGFWTTRPLGEGAGPLVERMLGVIQHRGPDGRAAHLDRARGLAMGHARLSIIDLATGDQPLFSEDRSAVLTCNGELYDYKPLRARLAVSGARFRTKSDSEIALPLYERHGIDFVKHLRGEFAAALFDARRERLILVRDRFGVKPLHVHVRDDGIYWASEIKSLLAHPDVPRALDPESVQGMMMNLMIPGRTAFEGIRKVEPGQMLVVERRGDRLVVQASAYWDLDFPRATDRGDPGSVERWTEVVQELLVDSIRVRLEADVPVGCYLSGGVDSCTILGLAGPLQQSPVKAFTIGFDVDSYDESGPAEEMARSVGADQEIVRVRATDLYGDSYVDAIRHAERVFYNPFGVAKYHLSRAVRDRGYRVVITGEGSDELFGGYPFFKLDFYRHGGDARDERALSAVAETNAVFKGATITDEEIEHPALQRLIGFTPAWIQPWILTYRVARSLFHDDVLASLGDYDPVDDLVARLPAGRIEGRHPLDRVQYTYAKTLLESQVLGWSGDRMDMAHSVEARPAFLDHLLAEALTVLPPGLRIRGGVEKWILREAARHVLPASLYRRQKFAFMAPPSHVDEAKRAAMDRLVERYLSPEPIRALGLCDPAKVGQFLERLRGRHDPATSNRLDIVLNHLVGLHALSEELVRPYQDQVCPR